MTVQRPRPSRRKSPDDIAQEWDRLAELRSHQIENGMDLSFSYVLMPLILDLIEGLDRSNVLDIGCGTGFLTKKIAGRSTKVVGLDISAISINWASRGIDTRGNVKFIHSSLEAFAKETSGGSYTLIVSNMTLMTVPNLVAFVSASSRLLRQGGCFVFTVCHPCFWPFYWEYASEPWFHYEKEIYIEAPFKISLDEDSGSVSTHIHRPMQFYFAILQNAGLTVEKIIEPMPGMEIEHKYDKKWIYPRFLSMQCRKQ
jgi:SAM-dependent methyltransferase